MSASLIPTTVIFVPEPNLTCVRSPPELSSVGLTCDLANLALLPEGLSMPSDLVVWLFYNSTDVPSWMPSNFYKRSNIILLLLLNGSSPTLVVFRTKWSTTFDASAFVWSTPESFWPSPATGFHQIGTGGETHFYRFTHLEYYYYCYYGILICNIFTHLVHHELLSTSMLSSVYSGFIFIYIFHSKENTKQKKFTSHFLTWENCLVIILLFFPVAMLIEISHRFYLKHK